MKLNYHFKHGNPSQPLMDYCDKVFHHFQKFLLKDGHGNLWFTQGRFDFEVEFSLQTPIGHYKASAKGANYYNAIDDVEQKMLKQLQKSKEKIKNHKKPPSRSANNDSSAKALYKSAA